MTDRRVAVASRVGLHARPAAVFTQAVTQAGMPVTLTTSAGKSVNAASILGVLSLGIGHGETVVLTANGDGADDVLDALVTLLSTDLDSDSGASNMLGS